MRIYDSPIILLRKARRLRRETGDNRWKAPIETMQQPSLYGRLENTLGKPFKILFQEPMLIAVTAYMSVSCEKSHHFFHFHFQSNDDVVVRLWNYIFTF